MEYHLSFYAGKREGLKEYAWWKDGVQYVGTTGTTLREAIDQIYRDEEKAMARARSANDTS